MIKRTIGLLLVIVMTISFAPNAFAQSVIGWCGNNVEWELRDYDTLVIHGTGNMNDYTDDVTPWYDYESEIKNVIIEDGVTNIGSSAFNGLISLEHAEIADSVTAIGEKAFYDCKLLTEITIPAGVTYIGESAFAGSRMLNIYVNEHNAKYSSVDGILFNKDKTELIMYSKSGINPEYVIPNSVISIADGAFEKCEFLTSLKIHSNVNNIGDRAFLNCRKLNISVDTSNPNYSDINGVLFNKNKTKIVAYRKDEINSEYIIPDSVTEINSYAFYYSYNLQRVEIPAHVKMIGDYAFNGCEKLKEIELPQKITQIGPFTFSGCEALEVLTIPDGVEEIGEFAFSHCSCVSVILIPTSVKYIRDRAFSGVTPTKIYYGGSQADWSDIEIGDGNYGLDIDICYNIAQIPAPSILLATVTKSDYMYLFNVSFENIPYNCYMVTALYKDGILIGMSSEIIGPQDIEKTLSVKIDDTQSVNAAKVFIFNDLYRLKPLCDAKTAEFAF